MIDATDFRIEDIRKATVNGVAVKIFKAFKKEGSAFVFAGQFSAPQRTANKNLWMIANGDDPATRPVGRPTDVAGRNVNTYLDSESIAIASRLGDGNVSEGIRKALKAASK